MAQASIADRIVDTDRTPSAGRPTVALVSRILLSGIFLVAGIGKMLDLEGTAGYLSAHGAGSAKTLALIAGLAEIAGGLSLAFGFLTRLGAIGLILFLIPTTYLFHSFWAVPAAEMPMQMSLFFKNLAIMGGLGLLLAFGPGRYSLDQKLHVRARHR